MLFEGHQSASFYGVIDEKLYVAGGADYRLSNTTDSDVLEVYDPVSDTWTLATPLPEGRSRGVGGVINGKLYAISGTRGIGNSANTSGEVYNPATDSWSSIAPAPMQIYHVGSAVVGNKLYVPLSGALGTLAYDAMSNSWQTGLASPPSPRDIGSRASAVGFNGKLYLFGGFCSGCGAFTDTQIYDPNTNTWSIGMPMPAPRHWASAIVMNDLIYLIGGNNGFQGEGDRVDVYDPNSDSWTTVTSLATFHGEAPSVGVIGENLYVAGGRWTLKTEMFTPSGGNTDPVADAGADQTVECMGSLTAVSLDGSSSTDPDGDTLGYEWSLPEGSGAILNDPFSATPTGQFPVGPTLVTLTVTDGNGGVAFDDVLITVEDSTPPVLVCTTDLIALWPADHKMKTVAVRIAVSDACSSPETLDLYCVASSSEPDDGNGDGASIGDVGGFDGHAAPVPIALSFDGTDYVGRIDLRAERDGDGLGRSYSIVCEISDASGNSSTASCVVVVPHNRSK